SSCSGSPADDNATKRNVARHRSNFLTSYWLAQHHDRLHSTKLGPKPHKVNCHATDTFETARLLLRPVTIMDVDAIFGSYAQDEEVVRYLIWRPHRSRSETQAYVERCMATPSEVERTYMLVGRGDNVVRGALALRQRA